jgi:superfamily II DNA or RNA helicase
MQSQKRSEVMNLRQHQDALRTHLQSMDGADFPADILADVVPGGGKSVLPGLLAERFPKHRVAWFVPRLSLARQAALGMLSDFGIEIRESGNDIDPTRGTRGFVATHSALTTQPDLWEHELRRHPYLLVIDELHHAKQLRSGEPNALAAAISRLRFHVRLCMTGTLETNDSKLIYNVPYSGTSRGYELDLQSFSGEVIRYSRSSALAERAIVPVEFHYHDGPVRWEDGNGIQERTLSDVDFDDEGQAVWTALRTDLAQQLLSNCVSHWRQFGNRLLVVTADQQTAKSYHTTLRRQGISSGLAISEADDAHSDIEQFRNGGFECLVTCQMAYEGLDVPPITHVACLTHIRSRPWIEQMLARAWRSYGVKERCWAFVPNDPRMNRVIEKIRQEQDVIVPLSSDAARGCGISGVSSTGFVPISGEVASVTAEMLDGSIGNDELFAEFASLCAKANIPTDHPMAAQFLSALRSGGAMHKRDVTVAEKEFRTRNEISKACNRADYEKKCDPGTHQKRLWKHFKKSITQMTLKELENARTICARFCS